MVLKYSFFDLPDYQQEVFVSKKYGVSALSYSYYCTFVLEIFSVKNKK